MGFGETIYRYKDSCGHSVHIQITCIVKDKFYIEIFNEPHMNGNSSVIFKVNEEDLNNIEFVIPFKDYFLMTELKMAIKKHLDSRMI